MKQESDENIIENVIGIIIENGLIYQHISYTAGAKNMTELTLATHFNLC